MTERMERTIGVVALGDQGALPEWIRVLPLGTVNLADGRESFQVEPADLLAIVEGFAFRGVDLVIDYEHQSLGGERAPAAGWIKELQARGDGLWGRAEWTPQAGEYLKNKEYRYFSPVLRLDPETRRPTALLHLGLTNVPAIRHLHPLVAKATQPQEEATAMLKTLIAKLGLAPETTEDQVLALVGERVQEAVALKQQAAALPEIATVLALKADASVSEIIGTIKGLKGNQDRLAAVETELVALKTARTLAEAEGAVDAAIAAKKITPAMREIKLRQAQRDLAEFRAEMAVAPVILAEGELKIPVGKTAGGVLDPVGLEVCKQLGIKPEDHLATKQQLAQSQ